MKLTINTEVLSKYNLSLNEFLLLLLGYYNTDYIDVFNDLVSRGLIEENVFKNVSAILSDNTKNLIAKILIESDDKAANSGLDFEDIALKMMSCYPSGNKPGTTYKWQGTVEDIAQRLRTLVVTYDFDFTEEEAVRATEEYVSHFKNYKEMSLLRNFIFKVVKEGDEKSINSSFMTIIENLRYEKTNH